MSDPDFVFFLSCDINLPIRFKIESLTGDIAEAAAARKAPPGRPPAAQGDERPTLVPEWSEGTWNPPPELYVECLLYIDGVPFGLNARTRHASKEGQECRWNEWVTLSAKYSDLAASAQLAFTVWDVAQPRQEVAVGGATCQLFNRRHQLKSGRLKQHLWPGRRADGAVPTATPGKLPKHERGELERLEKVVARYDRGQVAPAEWLDRLAFQAIERVRADEGRRRGCSHLQLLVEFPAFDHPVAFQEEAGGGAGGGRLAPTNTLVRIYDPELEQKVNPSEHKQLKLARMLTRGTIDRDLKPNSAERKEIAAILAHPPTRTLTGYERQLLWRFQFSLTSDKRALTKFLRCVDWSDAQEAKRALELMYSWAPIDIADALELLSPAFVSEEVRAFAVTVLERADNEELQCYLLQLVQALRYERSDAGRLGAFLTQRATADFELCVFLHWYLLVEWQDAAYALRYSVTHQNFVSALLAAGPAGEALYEAIRRQNELAARLLALSRDVKAVRGGAQKKVERLRQLLTQPPPPAPPGGGLIGPLTDFSEPTPLPLNPKEAVVGIIPQESTIFRSALTPLKLTFRTEAGHKVRLIYKKGDDLRQDQLIIQMLSLMDRLLKKENLDLKLTPYRVLATGRDDGLVEFIPSTALAQVLAENRTIVKYLRQFQPDDSGPFGLAPECLETFVKSCAGYCVIMYLLGVGDRHLDNLLLCDDGRLFHIDFGFILGRDPKPFPPPMKLCKEMVEAMGGAESEHYRRFKSYCCEAYNILRKSSNLILNLFHLMAGANIPDIASDPEKGILKLQQKFRLDLDDEAAVQFFQTLINESVSALFPQMVETIHRWAQYWR